MSSYNPNYFRKGLLPLLLLHLLQEKDMYGYELVKTIAARTNGTIADDEAVQFCIVVLGPFHHLSILFSSPLILFWINKNQQLTPPEKTCIFTITSRI